MRILFALAGLHRIERGAEIAFISIARELTKLGHGVTVAGSGDARGGEPYRFLRVGSVPRKYFERFPNFPPFRDVTSYEEVTFIPGLLRHYKPADYDITVTCSYPFTNWALRRPVLGALRPPHVYVTENGDWPARSNRAEYGLFNCEGLVCINPDFYEMNKSRWFSALIPNGVDAERFRAGKPKRGEFGLPENCIIILMVSALIPSKRVDEAIIAVSRVPSVHLAVAGDGPMRDGILIRAQKLLPGRFTSLNVASAQMPDLYRSADIFLHMSFEESFGNVYLEAMASGLPIIAHDSPRLRWIMGEEGHLLDTQNIEDVANCIACATPLTLGQRVRLQASASRFNWSKIALDYERFFRQVIDRSKSRDTPLGART